MTESTIKAVLPRDIKRVWDTVTSMDHYEWRGDLDRIEIQDDKTFIEHTKSGYSTVFTVTACIPMERWEFDMENDNISGHWIGIFSENSGQTTVDFTEQVTVKKAVMKPFAKMYLKKQQSAYIRDLKKELGK